MRLAVVRVEVVAEDIVHVDEEGLSLLLLLQKHFIGEEAITAMLKVAWEKLCALRYANCTYRMRKSGKKQQCVSQEIWASWQKAWEDPVFKRKCDIFARNRCSETGSDGARHSRHTGGSISTIETSQLLAKKYGRKPTPMKVFTYTHTKDHDENTFVDRRALGVNENYSIARERVVSSQAGSEAQSRIDELALYLEALGGKKKRKAYGIGAEEISALRARVDERERQVAELRAHVMRMSDQHGVSTSSSNLLPATNRDVSTALHQPLPSPLDPDTADDTLVTPADTTTHPVDTPADVTTLDHAEDRPRRFDFGPF
ncbi:hypothetical protein JCGZ_09162 [Jatropha curcas]|uniref:Uncharacterized protein n=1 Tax=Jatropha curcas TaxID=180498 RepID=A0A067KSQ7_JATCU|nr:hypothetical protein JCGZ_09162 [Jatropha curcas]